MTVWAGRSAEYSSPLETRRNQCGKVFFGERNYLLNCFPRYSTHLRLTLRSVWKCNTRFYFQAKTAFTPPGHVRLPRKQKKQLLTQTISFVPGRARAGAARDGQIPPLCTPAAVPTAKSGAETSKQGSGTARSTRISH